MSDILISLQQDIKIRMDKIVIFNDGAKQLEWQMVARPVNTDGSLGLPVYKETIPVPVDMDLVQLTPANGTTVDIAPGVSVPLTGVSGAVVYAWLQWYGETLCESRKIAVGKLIKGEKEPEPEVPQSDPDPNVGG